MARLVYTLYLRDHVYISTLTDLTNMLRIDVEPGQYKFKLFNEGYVFAKDTYYANIEDLVYVFSTRQGDRGLSGTYYDGESRDVDHLRIFNTWIRHYLDKQKLVDLWKYYLINFGDEEQRARDEEQRRREEGIEIEDEERERQEEQVEAMDSDSEIDVVTVDDEEEDEEQGTPTKRAKYSEPSTSKSDQTKSAKVRLFTDQVKSEGAKSTELVKITEQHEPTDIVKSTEEDKGLLIATELVKCSEPEKSSKLVDPIQHEKPPAQVTSDNQGESTNLVKSTEESKSTGVIKFTGIIKSTQSEKSTDQNPSTGPEKSSYPGPGSNKSTEQEESSGSGISIIQEESRGLENTSGQGIGSNKSTEQEESSGFGISIIPEESRGLENTSDHGTGSNKSIEQESSGSGISVIQEESRGSEKSSDLGTGSGLSTEQDSESGSATSGRKRSYQNQPLKYLQDYHNIPVLFYLERPISNLSNITLHFQDRITRDIVVWSVKDCLEHIGYAVKSKFHNMREDQTGVGIFTRAQAFGNFECDDFDKVDQYVCQFDPCTCNVTYRCERRLNL